ncbi:MAG: glutathione S-transferase family protein, partial [Gammaproteobacteria bacterium]|nr:glutathione S-transferase family protein [Gammaproteobacteria bacterium]
LAVLDGRLNQKPWLLGDAYTLADLIVASVIGYSVYLGAPVAGHPTTHAWLQKVQARPSMQIDA